MSFRLDEATTVPDRDIGTDVDVKPQNRRTAAVASRLHM